MSLAELNTACIDPLKFFKQYLKLQGCPKEGFILEEGDKILQ
jgi:hypothetical protein